MNTVAVPVPPAFLTVVIPVRNDAARLRRCLESIIANEAVDALEVVVVDNGSNDDSAAVARAFGAAVLHLPGASVGALRNAGAAHGSAPLVAFIDADHVIDPQWARAVADIFRTPGYAAAGAPYSSPPDANRVQRAYGRLRPRLTSPLPAEWLGSGNLVVRRTAFERVHGFDPSLAACEDVDLCNRLRDAGYRLVADPRLRSVHAGDPRTLRSVFLGELWRGRNNLLVTLSGPPTRRALASLAIPLVDLTCLGMVLAFPWVGIRAAVAAGAVTIAASLARAIRMSLAHPPMARRDIVDNVLVALAYDIARALALVVRATHDTRRDPRKERALA